MKSNFLGAWKLLHCKSFGSDGNEVFDSLQNASGMIMYDQHGTVAVQIMGDRHTDLIENDFFEAPSELFERTFKNYLAYYGPYTINESERIVTHHITGALWPNMIGTALMRYFEFKEDQSLVLTTVKPEAFNTKDPAVRQLTWSRVL